MKFLKAVYTTKATLDCIHYDYWGPLRVPFLGGSRYFLSNIDGSIRMKALLHNMLFNILLSKMK